ncbi:hypothetical protein [Microterricola pindariensis]|uniref:Multidrug transporter n=1 Tax=Microterricola pindariensis TaxID=478010 RepID=A0ABX5AYE1_9MICO|nr:hypothetical protein [Microterricola pindariensis]PPL19920.1 hypothetical protein GY24_03125 [Microterricola pindariensis]
MSDQNDDRLNDNRLNDRQQMEDDLLMEDEITVPADEGVFEREDAPEPEHKRTGVLGDPLDVNIGEDTGLLE